MKKFFRELSNNKTGLVMSLVIATILTVTVVHAGSLTPPSGTPGATGYTLTDIYLRLTANTSATAANHSLSTSTAPAASFYTLTQIYNAIPTIDPATVATGTTILGVSGTLLGNLYAGSGQSFSGGSPANGGIDDNNNGSQPPSDRYATTWLSCTSGNNYCGTGDPGARAKDIATGLIFSSPCSGAGCASFSTSSATVYTWDNSGANNSGMTASQLCSSHTGWYLPHQKQMMQAYIDGAYGNLVPVGDVRSYWEATLDSRTLIPEWIPLSTGGAQNSAANTTKSIICVHS